MRRCIATILLALFSWTLVVSAFASPVSAVLPACCRKAGKHQCEMHMHESSDAKIAVTSIEAKCSYSIGGAGSMHVDGFAPSPAGAIYAALISHPSVCLQTDAGYRISSIRSRQKRGPPTSLVL